MSSRSKALQYYILVRLLLAPLMLWTIFTVAFLLLRATPGDPVDAVLTLSKCDRANSFPDAIALILLKCDRAWANQFDAINDRSFFPVTSRSRQPSIYTNGSIGFEG